MYISIDTITTFLKFLNPHPDEIYNFAFLDAESKEVLKGFGIHFATQDALLELIPRLQKSHADRGEDGNYDHSAVPFTLHVTLNRSNLNGRKNTDMQSCRVLCLDIDDPEKMSRESLREFVSQYGVQMVVESSPGKYHIYWKVDECIPLRHWQKYQLGIAHLFGGDMRLDTIAKTIRVPGIPRILKDGSTQFLPEIIYLAERITEYKESEVAALFPGISEAHDTAIAARKAAEAELRKAIRGKDYRAASELSGQIAGGRNQTLYTALKDFMLKFDKDEDGKFIEIAPTEDEVSALASEINSFFSPPLDESELEKTWNSAYARGLEARTAKIEKLRGSGVLFSDETLLVPIPVNGNGNGHHPDPARGFVELRFGTPATSHTDWTPWKYDYTEPLLKDNRFTEGGLAARALQRFHAELVRVADSGTVYAFDSSRKIWVLQGKTPAIISEFCSIAALDTIHDPMFITKLCLTDSNVKSDEKERKAQERFLNLRLKQAAVRDVLHSPRIREVPFATFDADPYLLFCPNGVLDMRTGVLRAPVASDYLLARTDVAWDEDAECPGFLEFLVEVFTQNSDPESMVLFIQELFGYSISGLMTEQKLFAHQGDGANGKSKLLSALNTIAGAYSTYVEPEDLVKTKGGFGRSFERFGAKIEGKRCVIIDDLEVNAIWNEGTVKNLTAKRVRARAEYQTSRQIENRAKLHLGLNVAPLPEAENYGILRRLCFIPYRRRFIHDPATSAALDDMIATEAPGILKFAVQGLQRMYVDGRGLKYPNACQVANETYQEEFFSSESLLEEMLLPLDPAEGESPEHWHWVNDIYSEFVHRQTEMGIARSTVQEFTTALKRFLKLEKVPKVWDKERKNNFRGVFVRLKYEPNLSLSGSVLRSY